MDTTDPQLLSAFRASIDANLKRRSRDELGASAVLRAEISQRLAVGVARARASGLVSRVWLFGSCAWGSPRPDSDVDLLFEGARDPFMAAAVIEAGLGREVDAIRIERAPAALRERVLREGIEL